MQPLWKPPLVNALAVKGLFGRYDYDLRFPMDSQQSSRLALLHGDNGSGKTTVLRLLWHTLSSADASGHRTYISQTPFRSFDVWLRDDCILRTVKADGLVGTFTTTLTRPGHEDLAVTFEADEDLAIPGPRRRSLPTQALKRYRLRNVEQPLFELDSQLDAQALSLFDRDAEEEFFSFLAEAAREPLFLADDRSLYSDNEEIQRTRSLLADRDRYDSAPVLLSNLVFQELQVTLQRVNTYLSRLALGGQDAGSVNSNSVYETLLRQLAAQERPIAAAQEGVATEAASMLDEIEDRASDYERYGLVPRFDTALFKSLLQNIHDHELAKIAEQILRPYLSGLIARYDALSEAKNIVATLIATFNSFLRDKFVTFSPRDGIRIMSSDERRIHLPVESLSSGERQLLMLLCTTILAREQTHIFIIDEPELSLGVEWQRTIVDALLNLTTGSDVQFLMATHSIEIITAAADSLVLLENER